MEHWGCLHWSFMTISSQIHSDIRILRLKSCIAASVLIVCLSPRLISGSSIIHMLTMFGVYICSLVSPTSNKNRKNRKQRRWVSGVFTEFFLLHFLYFWNSVSTLLIIVLLNTKTFLWETISNGDALETKLIKGNASFCLKWYCKLTVEK